MWYNSAEGKPLAPYPACVGGVRVQAGETDDRMDYGEWASLVQMADNLRARLRLLAGEG